VEWSAICTRLRADPNDQMAWDALSAYVRALARARLLARGEDIVEDVVADTCAAVVLDLDAAHGPATFRGFVIGKLLNAMKAAIRLAADRRASLDLAADLPSVTTSDAFDARLLVLDRCLEGLPERDRRAVELRYFQQARAEHIARELQVSAVNARRIVFNGVNRLRRCAQAAVGASAAGSRGQPI
jgi:RNA polymerase sigma factor (sigma-70 family)